MLNFPVKQKTFSGVAAKDVNQYKGKWVHRLERCEMNKIYEKNIIYSFVKKHQNQDFNPS